MASAIGICDSQIKHIVVLLEYVFKYRESSKRSQDARGLLNLDQVLDIPLRERPMFGNQGEGKRGQRPRTGTP